MSSTTDDLLNGLPGSRRSIELRDVMARAGIRNDRAGLASMKTDEFAADVIVEPDGFVTVRADADDLTDPLAALQGSGLLPGNARFAITSQGWKLAAETRVDGISHLPDSLGEIRTAFRSALTGRKPRRRRGKKGLDPAEVIRRTITESGWDEEQIVETDQAWELQPRLAGETVPVELRTDNTDARVSRDVLPDLPVADGVVRAVSHQALLFNGRLRFVRLSVRDGKLAVETRLRAALIDAAWLQFAARAIASVARTFTPTITLLARDGTVANHYTELFLNAENDTEALSDRTAD